MPVKGTQQHKPSSSHFAVSVWHIHQRQPHMGAIAQLSRLAPVLPPSVHLPVHILSRM